MKICKYCQSEMMSEYATGRNGKSYTAFYNCPKCKAACDEKVTVYNGGRKKNKMRWYNPETKQFEEWKDE